MPGAAAAVVMHAPSERRSTPIRPLAHLPRQHRGIENQHDMAVAEVGRARNAVDADQRIGNGAHDDLALADDPVDGNADAPRRRCRPRTGAADRARSRAMPNSRDKRTIGSAPPRYGIISLRSTCSSVASGDFDRPRAPTPCGTAKVSRADRRDQRIGDRQRHRQLDHEPGAGALSRSRARSVPDSSLDRRLHDAHADAAPAGAIGFVARREARRAQQRRAAWPRPASPAAPAARPPARARSPPPRRRPRPSSAISMRTMSPAVDALSDDRALRPLAGGDALVRRSRCRG